MAKIHAKAKKKHLLYIGSMKLTAAGKELSERWNEIYDLYLEGFNPTEIKEKLSLLASVANIRTRIYSYRKAKREHLLEIMDANSEDIQGKYKWLQQELEKAFYEYRKDITIVLKIARELRSMYEFQMTLAETHQVKNMLRSATDEGRMTFISLLKKLEESEKTEEKPALNPPAEITNGN